MLLSPINTAAVTNEPDVSALSAVVIEANSKRIIWGKNENKKLPMASTTKIMSALLTLESGELDEEFIVDSEAVKTEGSSMGLCEGDIVTKRDLCIGMLLPSGNDAANCAAVRVGGNVTAFAEMMNSRAYRLGLSSTHFVTPSGLHDPDHYSTARDMAVLAANALENEDFLDICSAKSISLDYGNPPYERRLYNTNKLLGSLDGCIGVKTGFTDEAGRCLVSAVERDGVRLICVTLNASDDWNDHRTLYDYAFKRVSLQTADVPLEFDIPLVGSTSDTITARVFRSPTYVSIDGVKHSITYRAVIPSMIYAPAYDGDSAGELIIYDNGIEADRVPLSVVGDAPIYTPTKKPSLLKWLLY